MSFGSGLKGSPGQRMESEHRVSLSVQPIELPLPYFLQYIPYSYCICMPHRVSHYSCRKTHVRNASEATHRACALKGIRDRVTSHIAIWRLAACCKATQNQAPTSRVDQTPRTVARHVRLYPRLRLHRLSGGRRASCLCCLAVPEGR